MSWSQSQRSCCGWVSCRAMHNERSVARIAHPGCKSSIHWDWDTPGLWKYYTLQCQGLRNAMKCTCKPFDIGGKGTKRTLFTSTWEPCWSFFERPFGKLSAYFSPGRPAVNTGKTAPVDLNWLQVASLTLRWCVLTGLSPNVGLTQCQKPSSSLKDWTPQISKYSINYMKSRSWSWFFIIFPLSKFYGKASGDPGGAS